MTPDGGGRPGMRSVVRRWSPLRMKPMLRSLGLLSVYSVLALAGTLACLSFDLDPFGLPKLPCLAGFFWRGSLLVVHHYKKTTGELFRHYRQTWNITSLEGDLAEVGRVAGYNGIESLSLDHIARQGWNDCRESGVALFGRYQRVAQALTWRERRAAAVGGGSGEVCLPHGRVEGPACRRFFAVVEVVLKSERLKYVKEFIEHHLAAGFGHIYMGVDERGEAYDRYAEALRPYVDFGVVTLSNGFSGQTEGHLRHLAHANMTFWMARVDIDEFIFPPSPDDSVVPTLLPLTGRYGQVPLQLKLGRYNFGSGGWEEAPEMPLVQAYTWRQGVPSSVKSVFQTDGLLRPLKTTRGNPHYVLEDDVTCQDSHWVLGRAFWCWPQYGRTYWPPPLPEEVRTAVQHHAPLSRHVWDRVRGEEGRLR